MGDRWPMAGGECDLVLRFCDGVTDRLDGAQISGDRRRIPVRQITVGRERHRGTDDRSVRSYPVAHGIDDLRLRPAPDSGLAVGGYVRGDDMSELVIELRPAGHFHAGDRDAV